MLNIAIFASGTASNAERLLKACQLKSTIDVVCLVTNNAKSGLVSLSEPYQISLLLINNEQANDGIYLNELLKPYKINAIVLAGYLRKIPATLTSNYTIYNLHPSLLPKFGGKGMYGKYVHQAVFDSNEKESGITIHYVNEKYDEGQTIAQFTTDVTSCKSPIEVEKKIKELEEKYFATTIITSLEKDFKL